MCLAVPTTAAAGKKLVRVLHLSSSAICLHAVWEASCIMFTQASAILSMWPGIYHGVGAGVFSLYLFLLFFRCTCCCAHYVYSSRYTALAPIIQFNSTRHAVWEASCMYHIMHTQEKAILSMWTGTYPTRQSGKDVRTLLLSAISAAALYWAHEPACNAINQLYSSTGHLYNKKHADKKARLRFRGK